VSSSVHCIPVKYLTKRNNRLPKILTAHCPIFTQQIRYNYLYFKFFITFANLLKEWFSQLLLPSWVIAFCFLNFHVVYY